MIDQQMQDEEYEEVDENKFVKQDDYDDEDNNTTPASPMSAKCGPYSPPYHSMPVEAVLHENSSNDYLEVASPPHLKCKSFILLSVFNSDRMLQ